MIKIKRFLMLGRDFGLEPPEQKFWFYKGYDDESKLYCNCLVHNWPVSRSLDKKVRDRIIYVLERDKAKKYGKTNKMQVL